MSYPENVRIMMDIMHLQLAAEANNVEARTKLMAYYALPTHGLKIFDIIKWLDKPAKSRILPNWKLSDVAHICNALGLTPSLTFERLIDDEALPPSPAPPSPAKNKRIELKFEGPPYAPPRPAMHGISRGEIVDLSEEEPLASFFISRFSLGEWEEFLDRRTDDEICGAYQEWLDLQAAKETAK